MNCADKLKIFAMILVAFVLVFTGYELGMFVHEDVSADRGFDYNIIDGDCPECEPCEWDYDHPSSPTDPLEGWTVLEIMYKDTIMGEVYGNGDGNFIRGWGTCADGETVSMECER